MDLTPLTEGALFTICRGGKLSTSPVLQVLGNKKVAPSSSNGEEKKDRYRIFISDGAYSNSFTMLATQLNDMLIDKHLEAFTIIRANNYICNTPGGKKVLVLLDIDVLHPGAEVGQRIGNPVQINSDGTLDQNKQPAPAPAPAAKFAAGGVKRAAPEDAELPQNKRPLANSASVNTQRSSILENRFSATQSTPFDPSNANVFPIASLTPYQNRWTIKVRVTNKSDIRRWSNSKGEGHLFSMDLLDESGEIRATAFKDQCDKYYNTIEVGKLYYITACTLKPANKQFSKLNSEYELTLRDNTEVIPCTDNDDKIPELQFKFVSIADLAQVPKDTIVDIIGVCKSSADAVTITTRAQKELVKRDVTLVDQSLNDVNMTLWGTTAETFDASCNPVVAIKGVKVSDFNGVSLSTLSSSVIQINPDLPKAHALKGWFDSEGENKPTNSLTQAGVRGSFGGAGMGSNLKTIGEVKRENLGMGAEGKPDYYSTQAVVSMFQKDKALYMACNRVNDGKACNKKVIDQQNGFYRCEKCNLEVDSFSWRLVLSLVIADATDSQWVTCFQEEGEKLLGVSSQELGNFFQNNQEQYNKVFQAATLMSFSFRLSCKADNYNDEQRVRHTVRSAGPIDKKEYARRMIKELEDAAVPLPLDVKSKFI